MNNYFHDVVTAVLFVGTVILWALARPYPTLKRFALGAIA